MGKVLRATAGCASPAFPLPRRAFPAPDSLTPRPPAALDPDRALSPPPFRFIGAHSKNTQNPTRRPFPM